MIDVDSVSTLRVKEVLENRNNAVSTTTHGNSKMLQTADRMGDNDAHHHSSNKPRRRRTPPPPPPPPRTTRRKSGTVPPPPPPRPLRVQSHGPIHSSESPRTPPIFGRAVSEGSEVARARRLSSSSAPPLLDDSSNGGSFRYFDYDSKDHLTTRSLHSPHSLNMKSSSLDSSSNHSSKSLDSSRILIPRRHSEKSRSGIQMYSDTERDRYHSRSTPNSPVGPQHTRHYDSDYYSTDDEGINIHRPSASGIRRRSVGNSPSGGRVGVHRTASGIRKMRQEDSATDGEDDDDNNRGSSGGTFELGGGNVGVHRRHNNHPAPQSPNRSRIAAADKYRSRRAQQQRPSSRRRREGGGGLWRVGRLLRSCLFAGIPAYMVATVFFFRHASRHRSNFRNFLDLATDSAHSRDQRRWKDQREAELLDKTLAASKVNGALRRTRTVPPTPAISEQYIDPYQVWLADKQPRAPSSPVEDSPPMEMESICGYLAQSASNSNRDAYVERNALNSKSRVLITGILNPSGLHLALALKERCGVQVMIGIDNMYPNTVKNRMDLVPPMQLLYTTVPKLTRPIYPSFVGIDPSKMPKKQSPLLESTGELDLCGSFRPTHIVHLASFSQDAFFEKGSTSSSKSKNALYSLRSSLTGMEQILASIAAEEDVTKRPQFIYASSNLFHDVTPTTWRDVLHGRSHMMGEVLADFYHLTYGVESIAMRFPNGVYGPWFRGDTNLDEDSWGVNSVLESVLKSVIPPQSLVNMTVASDLERQDRWDIIHIDDVVDTLLAAMQYRSPENVPEIFDVTSGGTLSLNDVREIAEANVQNMVPPKSYHPEPRGLTEYPYTSRARVAAEMKLGWKEPHISLTEGIPRTLAWEIDQIHPFGPPKHFTQEALFGMAPSPDMWTGDELLIRHHMKTCAADNLLCHRGSTYVPCATGCSSKQQCLSSIFDSALQVFREVTEGCNIVLYTHELGSDITDLRLQSEYMADGNPLICNVALVSRESPLVKNVIAKVPDEELVKLGVQPSPEDQGSPEAFHERKVAQLNGRLLFRGWILVWPIVETPDPLPHYEAALIKMTPDGFMAPSVKYTLYVDQSFSVSPSLLDIQFLVDEMERSSWPARIVKRKASPRAKFVLPPEPDRRSLILLSELKYQEAAEAERLAPDTKVNIYEASRFMRFELGEEPLGKESSSIKLQRDFYERLASVINRDTMRASDEATYKFDMTGFWARTRWVLHDLRLEEARALRCEWFQQHISWGTPLDQLSFAFIMAKAEVERRMAHQEPDDSVLKALSENVEMKKLLSDSFEWHPVQTEQNKLFPSFEAMKILPYEIDYSLSQAETASPPKGKTPLFVRIISDRILAASRKSWNERLKEKGRRNSWDRRSSQQKKPQNAHEKPNQPPRTTRDKPSQERNNRPRSNRERNAVGK